MKILKMKLENFQGVKELEIDPQGESSAIYGDNGTGKSTVYNAFTWLMYGKPSTTEKNYTPKTTGSHNLHHSVEMTVELADGSEMVLKKDYHEVRPLRETRSRCYPGTQQITAWTGYR